MKRLSIGFLGAGMAGILAGIRLKKAAEQGFVIYRMAEPDRDAFGLPA